jgi:hypothetical protein
MRCFLLGQKFGALVVADHVGERDRRVFVDDDAVGAEVHGGDARGVDEALDASFAGHAQQLARAVDVGAVHGGGIGNPEAVVGGDVDDGVATGQAQDLSEAGSERSPTTVAGDAFEIGEVAGFAGEEAQVGAFGGQGFGYVMADKTGGACEEEPR